MVDGESTGSLSPNKIHPPFVSYCIQISFFYIMTCRFVVRCCWVSVDRFVYVCMYIYILLLLLVGLRFRCCGGGSQGETFVDPL